MCSFLYVQFIHNASLDFFLSLFPNTSVYIFYLLPARSMGLPCFSSSASFQPSLMFYCPYACNISLQNTWKTLVLFWDYLTIDSLSRIRSMIFFIYPLQSFVIYALCQSFVQPCSSFMLPCHVFVGNILSQRFSRTVFINGSPAGLRTDECWCALQQSHSNQYQALQLSRISRLCNSSFFFVAHK